MSATLLTIVGVIYVGIALSELRADHIGFAFSFLCYALANGGLIVQTWK